MNRNESLLNPNLGWLLERLLVRLGPPFQDEEVHQGEIVLPEQYPQQTQVNYQSNTQLQPQYNGWLPCPECNTLGYNPCLGVGFVCFYCRGLGWVTGSKPMPR